MPHNSRRQFLTHSAALAAAPLLASVAGSAIAQAPARKLGVALCGLGSLATNQIAPALLKTRNCRLAGIVTGTPSKAEEWKKKYGTPGRRASTTTRPCSQYGRQQGHRHRLRGDAERAASRAHAGRRGRGQTRVLREADGDFASNAASRWSTRVKKAGKMLGVGYRCQFEPNNLECVRLREGEGAR